MQTQKIPPISTPDTPNPWLATSTSTSRAAQTAEAKAKAREEQRSATTKGLANEMLGELKNLPIISLPAVPSTAATFPAFPTTTRNVSTGPTT
jgi:hypothetical protein